MLFCPSFEGWLSWSVKLHRIAIEKCPRKCMQCAVLQAQAAVRCPAGDGQAGSAVFEQRWSGDGAYGRLGRVDGRPYADAAMAGVFTFEWLHIYISKSCSNTKIM